MPAIAPISGNTTLRVGFTTTLTDATAGGTWSSSDPAIATVGASTGIVNGIAVGSCSIIYTVGSDSMAVTMTVNALSLSNGMDVTEVYNALKNRVLWQSQGAASDSGRYFEDFHTLCDPALLKDLQPTLSPSSDTYTAYLENLQRSVILDSINAIYNKPQLLDKNKLCFFRSDRLYLQPVANSNQFVGLAISLSQGDYVTQLTQLLLFFDKDCTFNMNLYDDMLLDPIYVKQVSAKAYEQTVVDLAEDVIFRNLTDGDINGGRKYFGYYQSDIQAQGARALYYNLNYNRFHPCNVIAFSAPLWTDPNGNRNFNRYTIGANNLMYGLNAKVSTYRDATNNIIQNAQLFDQLIGLQMAAKIVEAIIYSYRSNSSQRQIQSNDQLQHLYEELNLAKPSDEIPYSVGLRKKIEREVFRVKDGFQKKGVTHVGTA